MPEVVEAVADRVEAEIARLQDERGTALADAFQRGKAQGRREQLADDGAA